MRPLVPLHRRYLRTCRGCGYTWVVSRAAAGSGLTGEAGSESLTDAVDHIPQDYSGLPQASDGHPQAEPLLEALDENWNGEHGGATLREYAAAMNHCARCGIEDFDQRPLKRSEKIN